MPGLSEEVLQSFTFWLQSSNDGESECTINNAKQVLDDYYVEKTAEVVSEYAHGDIFYVALQFPDNLLHFAPLIFEALRHFTFMNQNEQGKTSVTDINYFVLGDTSYGECCVDEVAAQHLYSNLVVHYGSACLSPTRSLPVLYVFPRFTFADPQAACTTFKKSMDEVLRLDTVSRVVILYDLGLECCFRKDRFQIGQNCVSFASFDTEKDIHVAMPRAQNVHNVVEPASDSRGGAADKTFVGAHVFENGKTPEQNTAFVWYTYSLEKEDFSAMVRNAAIQLSTGASYSCRKFFGISLTAEQFDSNKLIDTSRILRKRFAAVGKVESAERIGIIPGTLGVSGNVEIIERCKTLIKQSGKRSYVILVGKPNPVKLANYPEIDVFVLVACPQNGIIDSKEYLRPIITPFELEAAILNGGDIFSSSYTMEFHDLLQKKLELTDDTAEETQLVVRGDWSIAVTGSGAGADYLTNRHWQGLKYEEGGSEDETPMGSLSTHIQEGESGIASGYSRERRNHGKNTTDKNDADS
ncbi:2-(3-amino-3-carboxypropyl)histidine synthase subunit 2 [Gracilariopsis chorda]|uniref:2-(3-amino-3-carboxypropyl)histidine synthase subunit 2 n=1 Tax=Gracilariopsis chorda TaxID=448386 RepID=A0A2V3J0H9_9FLOR|nr:2-(3-amino-3-carboxypropyl)histidine synthase subunit 2 [Gracilariopsis chorda]|eukprot:PXF46870.1 2-(3-amino-3-carboxypropyl)histidine synthase subunit 2 [Gracilariopsis chorda]